MESKVSETSGHSIRNLALKAQTKVQDELRNFVKPPLPPRPQGGRPPAVPRSASPKPTASHLGMSPQSSGPSSSIEEQETPPPLPTRPQNSFSVPNRSASPLRTLSPRPEADVGCDPEQASRPHSGPATTGLADRKRAERRSLYEKGLLLTDKEGFTLRRIDPQPCPEHIKIRIETEAAKSGVRHVPSEQAPPLPPRRPVATNANKELEQAAASPPGSFMSTPTPGAAAGIHPGSLPANRLKEFRKLLKDDHDFRKKNESHDDTQSFYNIVRNYSTDIKLAIETAYGSKDQGKIINDAFAVFKNDRNQDTYQGAVTATKILKLLERLETADAVNRAEPRNQIKPASPPA